MAILYGISHLRIVGVFTLVRCFVFGLLFLFLPLSYLLSNIFHTYYFLEENIIQNLAK